MNIVKNRTLSLLVIIGLLVSAGCSSDKQRIHAGRGVADLRNGTPFNSITEISGEWEFYPGRLITPVNFNEKTTGERVYLKVPGDWNKIQKARGYGTYRVRVILPENYPPLSLKFLWVKSASKVWIDSILLFQQGTITSVPENSVSGEQISIADFRPAKTDFYITIQVANYNDRRGGICFPVAIAPPILMYKHEMKITFVFTFIIGAIAIVMLFHFALFYFFRAISLNLYMSIICLMAILRLFLLSDSIYIYSLTSWINYNILVKAEFISLAFIFLCLLEYFTRLYSSDYKGRIKPMLSFSGLALIVYLLVMPVYYTRSTLPVLHVYILTVTIFLMAGPILRGLREKKRGAKIYMAIAFCSLPALMNDIWYFLTSTGWANISGYVFLIFFAGHFVVVSLYFVDLFRSNISLVRAIRLKNKIVDDLNLLSSTDHLTGLFNRRFFDNYLNSRIANFRKGDILWLIIFDVDHFKKVNDDFGHDKGDMVLRDISTVVKRLIRTGDVFSRWGGEEFAILIEGMEWHGIELLSERLRESIETHSFTLDRVITASFGVTSYINGESAEDFLHRCDTAMYKAKNAGRNRIVFSDTIAG